MKNKCTITGSDNTVIQNSTETEIQHADQPNTWSSLAVTMWNMPQNDLISRSALLKAWREIRGVCVPDLVVDCMIGETPAVDAEPVRHGRWIYSCTEMICSACTCEYSDEITYMCRGGYGPCLNYCPNCGAKMDAEVER